MSETSGQVLAQAFVKANRPRPTNQEPRAFRIASLSRHLWSLFPLELAECYAPPLHRQSVQRNAFGSPAIALLAPTTEVSVSPMLISAGRQVGSLSTLLCNLCRAGLGSALYRDEHKKAR